MIKSYHLTLTKEELAEIQSVLNKGLFASKESGVHKPGFYRLNDLSLVSEEFLEEQVYNLRIFRKCYWLEKDVFLHLEVGIDPDTLIPYIHVSLYTKGTLVAHHVALHELDELMTWIVFDLAKTDEIFELTTIGQELLSEQTYHIHFQEE